METQFTIESWKRILAENISVIKCAVDWYHFRGSKNSVTLPLDHVIQHLINKQSFRYTINENEFLEIVKLFYTVNPTVLSITELLIKLIQNDLFKTIDFFIEEKYFESSDVINYFVPASGLLYNKCKKGRVYDYYKRYTNELIQIFRKYKLSKLKGTFAVRFAIEYDNVDLLIELQKDGHKIQGHHVKHVQWWHMLNYIVTNYHPNKYYQKIKKVLYVINESEKAGCHFECIKDNEQWRYFFIFLNNKKRFEYYSRFKNAMKLRDKMIKYIEEYKDKVEKCVEDVSTDVVKYTFRDYLC